MRKIIQTIQKTMYNAFGLRFQSELLLPELQQETELIDLPDVVITTGDLTKAWEEIGPHRTYYAVKDDNVLIHIPNTALFLVRDGKQIIVSPMAGADERLIRVYLLGSCMGALLMQRQTLPLHGSAFVIDGKAYAIVGESGAGKSTLAAAFSHHGYSLLSDDVIAVSLYTDSQGSRLPMVTPSYPQQKLWQESLKQLGMNTEQYSHLYLETTKYAIPVSSVFCAESIPLAGIFELLPTEGLDSIVMTAVNKLERFPLLVQHTYRNYLIPLLDQVDWHFSMSAAIAGHTDIYRLHRPLSRFTANDLVTQIIDTVCNASQRINQNG